MRENMDIDREIEEIATKIMGLNLKTITENTPLRHCVKDGGYILNGNVHIFTIGYETVVWNPKENIIHAFELVDKVCSKDPEIQFDLSYSDGKWAAIFFISGLGMDILGTGDADTREMAICLAALKAAEGEG
jgi:hypothetical protein